MRAAFSGRVSRRCCPFYRRRVSSPALPAREVALHSPVIPEKSRSTTFSYSSNGMLNRGAAPLGEGSAARERRARSTRSWRPFMKPPSDSCIKQRSRRSEEHTRMTAGGRPGRVLGGRRSRARRPSDPGWRRFRGRIPIYPPRRSTVPLVSIARTLAALLARPTRCLHGEHQ